MHFHSALDLFIVYLLGSPKAHAISQMLSQNHTANHINFWLTDWKNRNARPDEVIIDASEALMNACVKAFAECNSVNSYITVCIDSILHGTKPPACFIRTDRSHFVRALTRNKMLRKINKKVTNLLLGVIGYVIQCKNIDECETILQHVFTLTKNEYVNKDVILSKTFLTELISSHVFTQAISSLLSSTSPTQPEREVELDIYHEDILTDVERNDTNTYKDTSMYHWILKIYDSVNVNNEIKADSIDNIYNCSTAEKFLFKVFVRLPLWSNIMCDTFGSNDFTATSAACESEFKNIKRLMGIKTHRVNVFVDLHLQQIFGSSKLAVCNQIRANSLADASVHDDIAENACKPRNTMRIRSSSASQINLTSNSILSTPNRSHSENDMNETIQKELSENLRIKIVSPTSNRSHSENEMNETTQKELSENWRGRNVSPPLLRRSRKSILNPHDIDYFCQDIPLLHNGYTTKTRAAGKKSIVVHSTCGMDSIFSVYCAAYLDNKVTKNEINESTLANEFSSFIKAFFISKKSSDHHYKTRTKLLQKIFSNEKYVNKISENAHTITVDCNTGIAGFFEWRNSQH